MTKARKVLIVEDNKSLRRTLATTLKSEGYVTVQADSVRAARECLADHAIDLMILDLGLPDQDGMSLLREMRAAGDLASVIVLTARDDEATIVHALDLGADDYITKPFGGPELLARIRSALRHGVQARGALPLVCTGDIAIDLVRRVVTKSGAEVKLSPKEYNLLAELAANVGNPVSHEQLLRAVWGSPNADVRYLRIYVGQVRDKIESDPQHPALLMAKPGYGCQLG